MSGQTMSLLTIVVGNRCNDHSYLQKQVGYAEKNVIKNEADPTMRNEGSNEINTEIQTITRNTEKNLTSTYNMIETAVTDIMKNKLGYKQKTKKTKVDDRRDTINNG